ncbi:MAG TPA: hypothetical protein DDW70_00080, partial [Rikenellaceae bacterium]|nr:hypothetical protein [Rikenellaceae bacterium]
TIKMMVQAIRRIGYRIRIIPYESWINELLQTNIRENPLRILASLFNKDTEDPHSLARRYGSLQPRYDTTNTSNFLKNTDIQKRFLTKRLLPVYLKYFMEQKYI